MDHKYEELQAACIRDCRTSKVTVGCSCSNDGRELKQDKRLDKKNMGGEYARDWEREKQLVHQCLIREDF